MSNNSDEKKKETFNEKAESKNTETFSSILQRNISNMILNLAKFKNGRETDFIIRIKR